MDSFDELRSEISKLVKWQSVIFCASCSERVTPIIRALARAELVQLWDDWLNQAWDEAIEGQESSLALLASIEATPESQYTDSHHSEYYVMRAIGVLWYALTAIGAADPSECAKWVSQSMESFASDFDVVISEQRRKEILKGIRKVRDLELKSQERTIDLLAHESRPSTRLRDRLRNDARSAVQDFGQLIGAYCQAHRWNMRGFETE